MADQGSYECERPDIIQKLADGDWFVEFIEYQVRSITFSASRLVPVLSEYNLREAYACFKKDLNELASRENRGQPIEQTKVVAFLTYWIRRLSPITKIEDSQKLLRAIDEYSTDEQFLLRYGNEFAAFDVGFRILRYLASRRLERYMMLSLIGGNTDFLSDMRNYRLSDQYIVDVCHMLKEKNVSPHSLYLIYRGLIFESVAG